MKGGVLILVFVLLLCLKSFAQNRGINERYELAYDEISQMLDGKTELSIQRAVFISEWAFLDGNLDYERDFRQEISRIAAFITKFIEANRIGSYKTAKQMAICEYLFNPWSGNNNTPYNYDLNDLGVGNWDTPQDFLNSDYNRDLGEEGVLDKSVNNYDYTEAFVIETSKEQDDIIRQTFVDIVSTEPYTLLNTNCATVVQRSMKKAGISVVNPETKTFRVPDNHSLGLSGFSVTRPNYNKIPSTVFKSIIKMNPNGKHIFKQH